MGIRYQSHVNPAALKSLSSLEKGSPPVNACTANNDVITNSTDNDERSGTGV